MIRSITLWLDTIAIYHENIYFFLIAFFVFLFLFSLFLFFTYLPRLITFNEKLKRFYSQIVIIYRLSSKRFYQFIQIFRQAVFLIQRMQLFARKFVLRNAMFIFLVLLLLTITTKFYVLYTQKSEVLLAPENIFHIPPIGIDLATGVIVPAYKMIGGDYTFNYGSSLTVMVIPLINFLSSHDFCSLSNVHSCKLIIYEWMVGIVVLGTAFLALLSSGGKKNTRDTLLTFYSVFLLGVPANLGFERGNIDIFLSLVIGFLLYLLLLSLRINPQRRKLIVFVYFVIGFLFGVIINSKIFILPFGLIALFASRRVVVSAVGLIVGFVIFSIIPHFYGIKTGIFDSVTVAFGFDKATNFTGGGVIHHNHSFAAIATLATDYVYQQKRTVDVFIPDVITPIWVGLFFLVFLIPFFSKPHMSSLIRSAVARYIQFITSKKEKHKFFTKIFFFLRGEAREMISAFGRQRHRGSFIMLLFVLINAIVNLLPQYAFDYRLFYSVSIAIILLPMLKGRKAQYYWYMSGFFLLAKGLWVLLDVAPKGMTVFDSRAMSLFIVLHFYYQIKCAYENVLSKA